MHLYWLPRPDRYPPDYILPLVALLVYSGSGSSELRHCEIERAGEGIALEAMIMAKGVGYTASIGITIGTVDKAQDAAAGDPSTPSMRRAEPPCSLAM
jgi:hypothetical protein